MLKHKNQEPRFKFIIQAIFLHYDQALSAIIKLGIIVNSVLNNLSGFLNLQKILDIKGKEAGFHDVVSKSYTQVMVLVIS